MSISRSFLINEKSIEKAKDVIKYKENFWKDMFSDLEFDEFGRAKVGFLPQYDESVFYSKIKQSSSKLFIECLEEAFKALRLKPQKLEDISYYQYLSKRITVETKTGFTQERSLPSILAKASSIWEEKMPMYRPLRNAYKAISKDRSRESEINTLKEILTEMENGNVYIAYDGLMRVFQPKDMYISINPLDKLLSSGGRGTNSLTKFSSCWRNNMVVKPNGNVNFSAEGEYSNPKAQVKLGEHPSCGMIIIPNDNELEVFGMKFYGMLQRSHIWLTKDGIFLENIYPDKDNYDRRKTITNILNNKVKIVEPKRYVDIVKPEDFDAKQWINEYNYYTESCSPYLDRSQIDRVTGNVKVMY